MNDIILEGLRSVVLLVTIFFILKYGRERKEILNKGWYLMVTGFLLLFLGSVIDITDNFESLNKFIIIGDTVAEAFIEKMVGFLGGFLFLAIGLITWIPNMTSIDKLNSELRYQNSEISANEVLEAILETSPYSLYIKDAQGKHIVVNGRFGEVTGLSKDKIIGKTNDALFPKEIAKAFNENDKKVLEGKNVSKEESLITPQGERTFLTEKFPIKSSKSNHILGVFGMSIDITEKNKIKNELSKKVEELKLMNNALSGRELKMIELKKEIEELKKGNNE